MQRDKNGNAVASVTGGPYDGHTWFVQEAIEGDKFIPLKTEVNRPIYRLTNESWVFVGYERHFKNDICPKCGGELDTGWECNDCGFDARPLVR